MINTLGIFRDEIFPGIKTIDKVADDVFGERLQIPTQDLMLEGKAEIGFLNSKGFGGNNATGVVASSRLATSMLNKRYGDAAFKDYREKNEAVAAAASAYDEHCWSGDMQTVYKFGAGMINDEDVTINEHRLSIAGFEESVDLDLENPFNDMV